MDPTRQAQRVYQFNKTPYGGVIELASRCSLDYLLPAVGVGVGRSSPEAFVAFQEKVGTWGVDASPAPYQVAGSWPTWYPDVEMDPSSPLWAGIPLRVEGRRTQVRGSVQNAVNILTANALNRLPNCLGKTTKVQIEGRAPVWAFVVLANVLAKVGVKNIGWQYAGVQVNCI